MIKSWETFNENDNAIWIYETDKYKELKKKYSISKSEIKEFYIDITDDFTFNFFSTITEITETSFTINYEIRLSKKYANPNISKNKTSSWIKTYQELGSDISNIELCTKRVIKAEELSTFEIKINKNPFLGAGNNEKEYDDLEVTINLKNVIQSDELHKAELEFTQSKNPIRNAIESVINKLVKNGVKRKDAKWLIDLHPDHESMDDVLIGFNTNLEILVIASFNKSTNKLTFEDEFNDAIARYEEGECSDYLN